MENNNGDTPPGEAATGGGENAGSENPETGETPTATEGSGNGQQSPEANTPPTRGGDGDPTDEGETLAPIQYFYTWSVPNVFYFADEDPIQSRTTQGTVPTIKRVGESSYHAAEEFVTITWKVTDSTASSADAEASDIATVDNNGLVTFNEPGKVKVWLTMTDDAGTKSASKTVSYTVAPAYIERADGKVAYATLYSAFNAAKTGETVVLGKDASLGNIGKMELTDGRDIIVDLNGYSVKMEANYSQSTFGAAFTVKKGTLTIKDSAGGGKVESNGTNCRAFNMDGTANAAASDAKLVIDKGVSVSSAEDCCVTVFGKATFETSGDLNSPADFAIAGNGGEGKGGYVIEVKDGNVTGDDVAIYHPNDGTLTVSGGTITGATGIYQKAGTLNITGGTIKGTGAKAEYAFNGDGCNPTGDAVVIDNCGYPGGTPAPEITGGTFISEHADPVSSHAYTPEGEETNVPVAGFVSGGQFSSEIDENIIEDGFVLQENSDGSYSCGDAVESVTLSKQTVLVNLGKTSTLTATILPETVADTPVTWSSSDSTVASVDENGKITGLKAGTAEITASASGKTSEACVVTVKPNFKVTETPKNVYIDSEEWTNGITATLSIQEEKDGEYRILGSDPEDASKYEMRWNAITGTNANVMGYADSMDPSKDLAASLVFKNAPSSNKSISVNGYVYYAGTNTKASGYLAQSIAIKLGNIASVTIDGVTTDYESINDAVSAALAAPEATIKLLHSTPYNAEFIIPEGKNVTVDLNGNKLIKGMTSIVVNGGSLTVTDSSDSKAGSLSTSGGIPIVVKGGTLDIDGASVSIDDAYAVYAEADADAVITVKNGASVTSTASSAIVAFGKNKVDLSSCTVSASHFALSNNGSYDGTTTFNIGNGAKLTGGDNSVAVYLPGPNVTTVNEGAEITGATGIYQKVGTLNIKGGTITGTGAKKDYEYSGDGCNPTGDAVVIDNCGYPGGTPAPEITGGTFISEHAEPVGSYAYTPEGEETNARVAGFVSGGTFSGEVSNDLCEAGFICEDNGDGTYGIAALAPIKYFGTWAVPSINYFADEESVPTKTTQGTAPTTIKREGASSYEPIPSDATLTWAVTSSTATNPSDADDSIATVDNNGLVTFTKAGKVKVWLTITERNGASKSDCKTVSYSPYLTAVEDGTERTGYATLSAAMSAVKGKQGAKVVILQDQTASGTFNRFKLDSSYDFTLDLGGKTLTMNGAHFTLNGAKMTVTNGTIDAYGNNSQEFTVNSGELNITESATINGAGTVSPIAVFGPATVNTAGTLTAENSFAIAGNGGEDNGGYTINITGGTITSTAAPAVYHPNEGTVNISGGTISGATGVYQKSGTLNITGGTIKGTGEKAEYTFNGNGANATGDAVVIDNCGYPGGVAEPSITGGTFISEHADPVGSYAHTPEGAEANAPVAGFVSGGVFSSPMPADMCAEGFAPATKADENGMYGIKTSLENAQEEALAELDAVDVDSYVDSDQYKVYKLVDSTKKSVGEAESDAEVNTLMDGFRTSLAEYKTKIEAARDALAALIEEAGKKDAADYTPESYEVLNGGEGGGAIAAANAVLAKEGATKKEYEDAAKALQDALDQLVSVKDVARDELEQSIEDAEAALNSSAEYTEDSRSAAAAALEEAYAVIEDKDSSARQYKIAKDSLDQAIGKLVTQAEADLAAARQAALEKVNAVDSADYIEADQSTVTSAKETALAKINAEDATQDSIAAAVEEFDDAISGCTLQADADSEAAAQLQTAKDEALAALDGVRLTDYSDAELDAVNTAVNTGKAAIADAKTVKEVQDALSEALEAINAQTTNAQKLASAKELAEDQLDAVDKSQYSGAELTKVNDAITTAKEVISNATTVAAVNKALADANAAIAACKTDGQIAADELEGAKKLAKDQLRAVDTSKYSGDELDAVQSAIASGLAAIDDATSVAAVDTALSTANTSITAQKTDEQKLSDAKASAITQLGLIDESNYSGDELTAVKAAIAAAREAIEEAKMVAAVTAALTAAQDTVSQQATNAQKAAAELQNAKDNANEQLDSIDITQYSDPEKTAVENAIEEAKTAIEGATTVDAVSAAVNAANETISKQKTDAQKTAEALAAAKNSAKSELDTIDLKQYSGTELSNVIDAIATAKAAIEAAENTGAVETAMTTARSTITSQKTDAQKAADALQNAKELANSELAAIDTTKYSDPDKTAVESAIATAREAIENAETADAVNAAMSAARSAIAEQRTDAQKEADALANAKIASSAILSAVDTSKYSGDELAAVQSAIESGLAAIDAATTVDDVNAALSTANASIAAQKTDAQKDANVIQNAKDTANDQINAVDVTEYSGDDLSAVKDAIAEARGKIKEAETVAQVDSAMSGFVDAVAACTTDEQLAANALQNAKDEAKQQLDSIDTSQYSGAEKEAVEKAIEDAKAAIDSATSVDDINKAMNAANDTISKQQTNEQKEAAKKAADEEAAIQGVYDPKLPKVKISKPQAKKAALNVKWKKLSKKNRKKCQGIEIWVAPTKQFKDGRVIKMTKKTKKSLKVKKLGRKKTYYVKVRTYKIVNGTKYVGKWSKYRKIKTK